MVTVRKSKLLSTSSVVAENTYYYEFDVDTIAELPDPYYNGTIVAHGSKATVINSGEVYRINGDGEWKSQSASGGAGLPEVTSEDNGDVLTVVDGAWDKAEPTKELPTVTSEDNGDVLTVVDGAWDKATPEKELPEVTSSDNGDVLTVVDGAWAKAVPSSAGDSVIFKAYKGTGADANKFYFENNGHMSDVVNAINNKKYVIINVYSNDGNTFYSSFNLVTNNNGFIFENITRGTNSTVYEIVTITNSNYGYFTINSITISDPVT